MEANGNRRMRDILLDFQARQTLGAKSQYSAYLIALRDNLDANSPVVGIGAGIANIDSALDRVLGARADVGARINRFESSRTRSADTDISCQDLLANIEDIDLGETIVKLTAQQNSL